jgi:hypothetical protein
VAYRQKGKESGGYTKCRKQGWRVETGNSREGELEGGPEATLLFFPPLLPGLGSFGGTLQMLISRLTLKTHHRPQLGEPPLNPKLALPPHFQQENPVRSTEDCPNWILKVGTGQEKEPVPMQNKENEGFLPKHTRRQACLRGKCWLREGCTM